MKTKINLLSSGLLASVLCLLCACTTTAQVPPANSIEIKQRNASGAAWEFVSITPQPDSALTFGADRKPATALLSTFAKSGDLSILNSTVGTLQTQVATHTGKLVDAETNITALQTSLAGKEAAGVAASLLAAHTAAANPHPQYALVSALSSYATLAVLNSATDSLAAAINAKAPLTHTHAQTDITGLAASLAAKVDTSDTRLHTHANKSTLDKITEGGGLPLWNGAAWPGGSGGGSSYTLPPATASTLGGIKVGANLSITADGTLSTLDMPALRQQLCPEYWSQRPEDDIHFMLLGPAYLEGGYIKVSDIRRMLGIDGNLWAANGPDIYRPSGKVGIGSAPSHALDVNGDINFTGTLRKNGAEWNPGSATIPPRLTKPATTETDWNGVTEFGVYRLPHSAANAPAAGNFTGFVVPYDDGAVEQYAADVTNPDNRYRRFKYNNVWYGWNAVIEIDAPADSKEYVRKNRTWTEATGGSGGIEDVFIATPFSNGTLPPTGGRFFVSNQVYVPSSVTGARKNAVYELFTANNSCEVYFQAQAQGRFFMYDGQFREVGWMNSLVLSAHSHLVCFISEHVISVNATGVDDFDGD